MLVDLEKSKRLFFKPSYISELLHDSSDDKSANDNEDVDDDENTGDDASDLEPEPTVPKPSTTKK